MPFRGFAVSTLNRPSRESVFTLHQGKQPSPLVLVDATFDFSSLAETSIQADFTSNKFVKDLSLRSVFLDLKDSDSPILIQQFQQPNFRSVALQGRSQGWIPICWNEPLHILVTFFGGAQLPIIVLSFATELITGPIWRTQ